MPNSSFLTDAQIDSRVASNYLSKLNPEGTGSLSLNRATGSTVGTNSAAIGDNTVANHKSQFVFGEYNVADSNIAAATDRGDYVEIVGNGTSSMPANARTLDWSGNEVLAGDLQAAGVKVTGSSQKIIGIYNDELVFDTDLEGSSSLEYTYDSTNYTASVKAKTSGSYSGDIIIPKYTIYNNTLYKVTSLGVFCFGGCTSIISVCIPGSIISKDIGAFVGCTSLIGVYIDDIRS